MSSSGTLDILDDTPPAAFKIGWANMHYGGLRYLETGGLGMKPVDDTDWRETIATLAPMEPDILALQEMHAGDTYKTWQHLWRTANALGMQPVLGPPAGTRHDGLHTALLIRTRPGGPQILDQWPPAPGPVQSWCYVLVQIPGIITPLQMYSGHANARSHTLRRVMAETITSYITEKNQLAAIAGDWNELPRGGPVPDEDELAEWPLHLQLTRCKWGPDRRLMPRFDVDDVFRDASMIDVAASLPAKRRKPAKLTPTTRDGGRIDRMYAVKSLANVAQHYEQFKIGSDHDAGLVTFDLRDLVL